MSTIDLSYSDACAVVRLNRPDVLNAINEALLDDLNRALDEIEGGDARAVILTGTGRAFCSGTDISGSEGTHQDARHDTQAYADKRITRTHETFLRVIEFPKPIIAALNGLVYGGGHELALTCTFRTAAPEIRLELPEIRLGLIPSYGGTLLLPRVIGFGRALEMMLTGECIDAEEARRSERYAIWSLTADIWNLPPRSIWSANFRWKSLFPKGPARVLRDFWRGKVRGVATKRNRYLLRSCAYAAARDRFQQPTRLAGGSRHGKTAR